MCSSCREDRLRGVRAQHPVSGRDGYGAGVGANGESWQQLVAEAKRRQPWCSRCGATEGLQGDHRDPEKRSGLTVEDLDVLCGPCNRRKGGR